MRELINKIDLLENASANMNPVMQSNYTSVAHWFDGITSQEEFNGPGTTDFAPKTIMLALIDPYTDEGKVTIDGKHAVSLLEPYVPTAHKHAARKAAENSPDLKETGFYYQYAYRLLKFMSQDDVAVILNTQYADVQKQSTNDGSLFNTCADLEGTSFDLNPDSGEVTIGNDNWIKK